MARLSWSGGWAGRVIRHGLRLLALGVVLGGGRVDGAGGFDLAHPSWARVLTAHVQGGLVDYAALRADPAVLDGYLEAAGSVTEAEFRAWSEADQIAFLCNVYNAATVRLVVGHYPVGSIKEIGGSGEGPWRARCVRLWGEKVSLDHVEHEVLRRRYREPRIHFALVCGARGCSPLRGEPYLGSRLSAQLDDQVRRFMGQAEKNRLEPSSRTVRVSRIFEWYRADFGGSEAELARWLRPFWPAEAPVPSTTSEWSIGFTDYDWSLNDRRSGR